MRGATAAAADFHTVMHQPLTVQALGDARLLEQADRALLEHAGTDAILTQVRARSTMTLSTPCTFKSRASKSRPGPRQ